MLGVRNGNGARRALRVAVPPSRPRGWRPMSLLEVADDLMLRYAPGVPFKASLRWVESEYREFDDPPWVKWYVGDGLTTLLHEIGHHVLRHTRTDPPWRQEITEEAEAWLWAEKTARIEGIEFDYRAAERWFATYFSASNRRQLVIINWRWRVENATIGNGKVAPANRL